MEYNFKEIEQKWQKDWTETGAYKVSNDSPKPKFYVLDMFPYPSGAGLHVGHPLGYIASDIYARYKRLKGFNVLHPMGYDSFGLPAEQYALETGQHPAVTTEKNIATFRSQLDKIGFCFDWSREVRTSDPQYYKWTQWIFLQLFNSWYNPATDKAEPIATLTAIFEKQGKEGVFTAAEWKAFDENRKQEILMDYRLAFSSYGEVNWCEALGTVLANDEVVNGVSERGGHPVIKKKMRQWYLRITAYADRLLEGLERVEFSESLKEQQRNWIGKSQGAEISFEIKDLTPHASRLTVYTTRPDTIFGVDFMVIAPEHELVEKITTPGQKEAIDNYLTYVKSRSDRERMAEVKQVTGCFTGAYAINPFNGREIPIYIAEYVLAGYGTGAIMAVPCGDQRDYGFAQHFNIPITNIIGDAFDGKEANATKDAKLTNSGFLDGMVMRDAVDVVITKLVEMGIGKRKINYKMRDAGFSRQRYWGEPFPIVWIDGEAYPLEEKDLPLELPHVDKYGPGPQGEGPLANLTDWVTSTPALLHGVEKGATPQASSQKQAGGAGAYNVDDELTHAEEPELQYAVRSPMQYELAKEMRRGHTEAEGLLWEELRNSKLGEKFRRQHPVDAYIVDFACLQKNLVVEVDGGYHTAAEQQKYDAERTKVLQEIGFTVTRFSNEEVTGNTKEVIKKIKAALTAQAEKIAIAKTKANTSTGDSTPPTAINKATAGGAPLATAGGEGKGVRETSTMPGYAGSSWYFLRYMDPHNNQTFCDRKVSDYWNQVDVYVGGTEHAVGHLLYSRLWTKVLYDLGHIGYDEPYKRLVNQGMITGRSYFFMQEGDSIVSYKKQDDAGSYKRFKYGHNYVDNFGKLTRKMFAKYLEDHSADASEFTIQWQHAEEEYIYLKEESEKMSKSKFNVDNPDDLVEKYGADTFRMYEMFLGPVEASKPWDTKGIEGVHRFLKKLWRLFYDEMKGQVWKEEKASAEELKILHRTIKKIEEDTERFSFNTAVSTFMICVNDLNDQKCHKKEVLEQLLVLLTPYAPHIAEELWHLLGNAGSVLDAAYPVFDVKHVTESSKEYPVSINGKVRTNINIAIDAAQPEVEQLVLANETVQKWLEGKSPKKIIYVKNKMVNVVV